MRNTKWTAFLEIGPRSSVKLWLRLLVALKLIQPTVYDYRKYLTTLSARRRLQRLIVTVADRDENLTYYYNKPLQCPRSSRIFQWWLGAARSPCYDWESLYWVRSSSVNNSIPAMCVKQCYDLPFVALNIRLYRPILHHATAGKPIMTWLSSNATRLAGQTVLDNRRDIGLRLFLCCENVTSTSPYYNHAAIGYITWCLCVWCCVWRWVVLCWVCWVVQCVRDIALWRVDDYSHAYSTCTRGRVTSTHRQAC